MREQALFAEALAHRVVEAGEFFRGVVFARKMKASACIRYASSNDAMRAPHKTNKNSTVRAVRG
jgi:hypothetical protein